MEAITIAENEKFLRQKSQDVTFPDENLKNDIEVVKEYLRTHDNCFAMASVQLGIPKRIVIIKSTTTDRVANNEKDWLVLINPEIINQSGKTEFWEGCQSGLTNFALVERPYKINLNYKNENGRKCERTFEGFVSTILSHEIDHLDGIFHMDRAKNLIQLPSNEWMEYRKNHPYRVYSKDEHFEYGQIANKQFDFNQKNCQK